MGIGSSPKRGSDRIALSVVVILHLLATSAFLSPLEVVGSKPLFTGDYPVHAYAVYMYREAIAESGVPWGYDPGVSAGTVTNPGRDLGAKPVQVLSLLLPFVEAGGVVRLFLFMTVLTIPLWTYLGCRRAGIPSDARVWVLVLLLVGTWLDPRFTGYLHWGIVGFVAASYFSIYPLCILLDFLERPRIRAYLAFSVTSSLLLLLHVLGNFLILPIALMWALVSRSLARVWRVALLLVPATMLVLNAFWVVPLIGSQRIPVPPDWIVRYPPGSVAHLKHRDFSELVDRLADPMAFGPLILAVALAVCGLVVLRRRGAPRVAISIAIAGGSALFMTYLGSFAPVADRTQPIRFLLPGLVFLSVPIGVALAEVPRRAGLPVGSSAAALAVVASLCAVWLGRPAPLPLPPQPDPLVAFVARETEPGDRLLIQSSDGYRFDGFEPKIFPLLLEREVIGCTYPVVYDVNQFLERTLWGKEIDSWAPDALRSSLEHWGIAWVFTVTEDARALFTGLTGRQGVQVGRYHAFPMPSSPTRFLIGSGRVSARVNRIEVTDIRPEDGLVVLRYRYHPAWRTDSGDPVYHYPLPEDSSGFIAFKDPPGSVTLHFDPLSMLRVAWPDLDSPLRLKATPDR